MPPPNFDDLDAFFNVEEFGTTATLQSGGGLREIVGIFDATPMEASIGASNFDAIPATFTTKSADVAQVKRGDTLTIDGETYQCRHHPKHDGTGMAVIELTPPGTNMRGSYA